MQIFRFETTLPFDHVPRALDILRKMGFELCALSVSPDAGGFIVDLKYIQSGLLSVNTFVERMAQTLGVESAQNDEATS